ncbi:hypothetical protein [Streptomyces sp. NPDC090994]|uniref:hypothetical protein n=1 Tax=Streptomyces sp. NPDC090994 TaxID=3365969 RepID=UPI0038260B9F
MLEPADLPPRPPLRRGAVQPTSACAPVDRGGSAVAVVRRDRAGTLADAPAAAFGATTVTAVGRRS